MKLIILLIILSVILSGCTVNLDKAKKDYNLFTNDSKAWATKTSNEISNETCVVYNNKTKCLSNVSVNVNVTLFK